MLSFIYFCALYTCFYEANKDYDYLMYTQHINRLYIWAHYLYHSDDSLYSYNYVVFWVNIYTSKIDITCCRVGVSDR